MNKRELAIKNCFRAWIVKDISLFLGSFADNVHYIESWGPAYRGAEQIAAWFTDWNKESDVLEWDIKAFFHIGDICICEWYFKWKNSGSIDWFDGVSIVNFNGEDKITRLKEFQSKTPNNYPYR